MEAAPLSREGGVSADTGRPSRAWSIRTHFLLFGVILVVPLAALSGFLLYHVAAKDRHELENHMVQIAAGLAADVDRELGRRITILQTLATSPLLEAGNVAGFHAQASAALSRDGSGIFLIEPLTLQQIVNTYVAFGTQLPTYGAPETAHLAVGTRSAQISNFFIGRVTKRPVFDIVIPVLRDGEVRYVLAMGLEPVMLQSILTSPKVPRDWVVSVADRNGTVLARSRDQEKFLGSTLPTTLSAQPSRTTAEALTLEGGRVLRATARSELSGWQIAVNFPLGGAQAGLRTNLMLLGAWSLVAVLLTAVGAAWFARIVARPIQAASEAAAGLPEDRPISPFQSHVIEANTLVHALHQASIDLSKAHAQQRLLLEELNHRVKNLLSVIIALTMRSLSGHQLKDARDLLIRRFHALKRTHDLLTANQWQGAALTGIVNAELAPFTGRFSAQGPDVVLNPGAAQTITMILHELVTNAAKYGAWSAAGGQVELTWSIVEQGEARLQLSWRERGGPAVSAPSHKGFGTMLLQRGLAQGTARLAYNRDGLSYEVEVPLAAITAAPAALILPAQPALRPKPAPEKPEANAA